MTYFFNLVNEGGWPAYAIVALGVFGFIIAVLKIYQLFYLENLNTQMFTERVLEKIYSKRTAEALSITSAYQKNALGRVFHGILEKSKRSDEAIQQAQDIALTREIPILQSKTNYLSMIANVSTLIGLLGTVQGLIIAFAGAGSDDAGKKQEFLAQGISVAMNTTALGLTVAIPMTILFVVISNRQNKITLDIYEKAGRLTEALTSGHFQALEQRINGEGQTDELPPNLNQVG